MAIVIQGLKKLQFRVRRAIKQNIRSGIKAIVKASALVETSAKKNMKGSRTRAIRLGRRVTAKPGVLGIDGGTLRASITFIVKSSRGKVTSTIGPQRVPYGAIHEFGGQAGRGKLTTIPARPYLGPALEENEERVKQILGKSFRIVIP